MSPPYWGYYVFHDNNRDTHQQALKLTQAVSRMFYEYHPVAIHDLHESIPLMHTWNGTGPYNAHLDPITIDEWLETSFHEVEALTALGMPGVWTWGYGESWGLHYLDSIASNHNSLGRGYETFGNHTAETVERTLRPSHRYVDRPVTDREWYRAWPPEKKFIWSLRDNTNYMESGCLSILDWAAKNSKELLRNFYRKGYNSWQKGVKGNPYAFVIPEDQGDPRRVAQMVDLLRADGIEVSRLTAPVTVQEGTFAKGDFVVKLDQPYRNYAVDLLEPQKFRRRRRTQPYDDVSWALPVHYGLEAKRIDDAKIFVGRRLAPVVSPPAVVGRCRGSRTGLSPQGHGPGGAARGALPPGNLPAVDRREAVQVGRGRLSRGLVDPAGAGRAIRRARIGRERARPLVRERRGRARRSPPTARRFRGSPSGTSGPTREVTGWLRLALDQEKIPYAYIRDEDVRAGKLREKYDILLYGDNDESWRAQVQGIDRSGARCAYTKTAEFPSHGVPDASDDITGGIGWSGMAEPAGVPGRRRPDDHARQRFGASARGRSRARRVARGPARPTRRGSS